MPKIEGFKKLRQKLKQKATESKKEDNVSVTVGYSQNYAMWVHERNKNYKKGQWKFLELPARSEGIKALIKTSSMKKDLIKAGLLLQRLSQKLVPIDTGALKASAFTSLTKDADKAASIAFVKSQLLKLRKQGK